MLCYYIILYNVFILIVEGHSYECDPKVVRNNNYLKAFTYEGKETFENSHSSCNETVNVFGGGKTNFKHDAMNRE